MAIAWLSNREIERSLMRARRSEQELKDERDLLEIKVEERTHELREVEFEKTKQLHRFAEFGQLASGLFHDILNLLNALSIRIERRPDKDVHEDARTRASLEEALDTTRQIENFMHAVRKQLEQKDSYESFSIVDAVGQAIQLLSYKARRENVRIDFPHNEDADIPYLGNPFKFHQILVNLLLNAIESYEGLPKNDGRERVVLVTLGRGAGTVTMKVEDHGCGIAPAIREKIFEPFFTTKSKDKGVGIGLATVKKIVTEELHGTITVASVEGRSSAFTITFPYEE
jgi:signal transduction histidine kinase